MKKDYTVSEAAVKVGVSTSRIRQLVLANEIDHRYFGRTIVITEDGIKQAKARKTKPGPAVGERRKAA